jgi:hypothetical protein
MTASALKHQNLLIRVILVPIAPLYNFCSSNSDMAPLVSQTAGDMFGLFHVHRTLYARRGFSLTFLLHPADCGL